LSGFQPDASHPDPGKIFVGQRMQELRIKALNGETPAANLSGGNQQKVVLPKWMNQRFKAILFDEPTRGVDVGAKAEIYQLIEQRAERGTAVVAISSELLEIVGLSDRFPISLGRRLRKSSRPDGTGTLLRKFPGTSCQAILIGSLPPSSRDSMRRRGGESTTADRLGQNLCEQNLPLGFKLTLMARLRDRGRHCPVHLCSHACKRFVGTTEEGAA
jgi:hypothetical protein